MPEQEFSPLRSTTSRKPWPECPDIALYRCNVCGRLFQDLGDLSGQAPGCCGAAMERLVPRSAADLPPGLCLDYTIVGGFNANAVRVFWTTEDPALKPEWILLRTFTGGYRKYVGPKKSPPLVFPLSDEDAYVYCDRPECERCVFRCKKGFLIYALFPALFPEAGLVELPMDKISEYFKTRPRS